MSEESKPCSPFPEPSGSEIVHGFKLNLTKRQASNLRKVWNKHGKSGGAIIMQPVLNWGPFTVQQAFVNAAVVNKECFDDLSKALASARCPNTKVRDGQA